MDIGSTIRKLAAIAEVYPEDVSGTHVILRHPGADALTLEDCRAARASLQPRPVDMAVLNPSEFGLFREIASGSCVANEYPRVSRVLRTLESFGLIEIGKPDASGAASVALTELGKRSMPVPVDLRTLTRDERAVLRRADAGGMAVDRGMPAAWAAVEKLRELGLVATVDRSGARAGVMPGGISSRAGEVELALTFLGRFSIECATAAMLKDSLAQAGSTPSM